MFACLYVPRFALGAVLRLEEGLSSKPVILVEETAIKPMVLELTPAAERGGVAAGMPVAQALGRCPEVQVRYQSLPAEKMASRVLFDAAYSFSPLVEETRLGQCVVDLRGVAAKTLGPSCEAALETLARLGLPARIGLAESPDLAPLAAWRATRGLAVQSREGHRLDQAELSFERLAAVDFLESLPIEAASPSEGLARVLQRWGIDNLARFVKLERQEVGKRLGGEGLSMWDRINGDRSRPLRISEPEPSYSESLDFEQEIDSLEPIQFLARRFLDQLCLRLRLGHLVAERLGVELRLSDIVVDSDQRDTWTVQLKVAEPTDDPDILLRLLAARLEAADLDLSIRGFSLEIDPTDRHERQLGLFETSLKNPGRFVQTLTRVAGIVGPDRVGRPVMGPSGRPDGFTLQSLPASLPEVGAEALPEHYGLVLRRFRPALSAEVEMQNRLPNWFRCSVAQGFISEWRGPWVKSGQWWEPGGWKRTEWDVALRKGGLYRLVWENKKWTVEGVYD